jgi:hypothetical protein
MSCESPFVYQEASVTSTFTSNVGVKGSYTLPGYTIPATQLCWLQWKAPYSECTSSKKNKWWKITKCNKYTWVKGSHKWCCCETIAAIPVWPNLTFTGSVTIPFEFEAEEGFELTVESPDVPYQATSITLKACNLAFSINGEGIAPINIIPTPIVVGQENGSFFVDIPLTNFFNSENIGGIVYGLTMDISLLFCLEPEGGSGWINLKLDCTLTAYEKGVVNYSAKFDIVLPIVSAEEE